MRQYRHILCAMTISTQERVPGSRARKYSVSCRLPAGGLSFLQAALAACIGVNASRRRLARMALFVVMLPLAGCGSFLSEGTSAGAGIAGAAIADSMTDNAAVATGIGLGVQAAAKAGLQYAQRRTRAEEQDAIAQAAARLGVGEISEWAVIHSLPIESDAQGKVTVSRLIGGAGLSCKEIVFSVVAMNAPAETPHAYYVTTICDDRGQWRWASAEPATARWGSLQ